MPSLTVLEGDCVEQMAAMPDASVDSIVTDPPYGLEFMGKDWDRLEVRDWERGGGFSAPGIGEREREWPSYGTNGSNANPTCATCGGRKRGAKRCACPEPEWKPTGPPRGDTRQIGDATFHPSDADTPFGKVRHGGTPAYASDGRSAGRTMQEWHGRWAREALRVLKPGGHLLAFGGTRTYHRLACALEDSGFELRDSIMWLYGSGFPKSLDVGKAIDKAARGVPQGGPDPSSPHHGQFKTQATEGKRGGSDNGQGYGAGPGQFMVGDIDPATGRRIIGRNHNFRDPAANAEHHERWNGAVLSPNVTAPATPEAEQWDGWGTALKPAHEPIVVARKPLAGTVAANVLEHGTGAMNVDACRIGWGGEGDKSADRKANSDAAKKALGGVVAAESTTGFTGDVVGSDASAGRWPANVVLSHAEGCVCAETIEAWECVEGCPVAELDRQTGELRSGDGNVCRESGADRAGNTSAAFGAESRPAGTPMISYGDAGGASRFFPTFNGRDGENSAERRYAGEGGTNFTLLPGRRRETAAGASEFFYCAKTSRAERNAGLDEFEKKSILWSSGEQNPGGFQADGADRSARNPHPTVKPIDLMRWLVRLVTPPGGLVLDPFVGSGTTGCACALEGFSFVGIDRETEYVKIAQARIAFWGEHPTHLPIELALAAETARSAVRASGQLGLL